MVNISNRKSWTHNPKQGNCRYGQNCRFDHIYGSKYSYHAAAPPQAQPQPQSGVTDEQLLNQVMADLQAALNGKQWILSCYSPFKEKPNFPGLTELSPEEARLFIYEAKATNNLDTAVAYMNNLIKEAKYKYEQLLSANPTILKVLRSLHRGETVSPPFTNSTQKSSVFGGSSAPNSATSVFRSAVKNTSVFGQSSPTESPVQGASIFGNTSPSPTSIFSQNTANSNPSVFNQNPGIAQNSNAFGQPNSDNAKSLFAQATQNVFGPSQPTPVFAQPSNDTSAKSIFAQATQNAFSGSQANPASVFGEASQSVFGKPSDPFNQQRAAVKQNDPFGMQNDVFSQQNNPFPAAAPQNLFQMAGNQCYSENVYSDVKDLSPEDIEAFKANDFKLGFIPEIPPPFELCF